MKETSHQGPNYCMISFIGIVQDRQIYRYKKWISSCLGLEEWWGKLKEGESQGMWGFFLGYGNVLKLVAQLREYSKSHWVVYFKWMNCMLSDYLNKTSKNKKSPKYKKIYVTESMDQTRDPLSRSCSPFSISLQAIRSVAPILGSALGWDLGIGRF